MKTTSMFRFGCSVVAVCLLAAGAARAQENRKWNNLDAGVPQSDVFNDDDNWNPSGVPGADDWAIFDHAAATAYTVTMDIETHSIQGLRVDADRLVLSVPTVNTLNLTAEPVGTGGVNEVPTLRALMIGNGGHGEMVIQGGGTVNVRGIWTSTASGSSSAVTVQGSGTHLNAASAAGDSHVGYTGGAGSLSILSGAKVSTNLLTLSRASLSGGSSILVSGSLSELNVAGTMRMGHSGASTTTIDQGGKLTTTSTVEMGRQGSSVLVFDGGTASVGTDLIIGFSPYNGTNHHALEVKNNSTFQARDLLINHDRAGTGNDAGTSTILVDSGSTVTLTRNLRIGRAATLNAAEMVAYFNVSGASTVSAGGIFTLTSVGQMTLHGGSTVTAREMIGNAHESGDHRALYTLMLNASSGPEAPLRILTDGDTYDGDVALGEMAFDFDFIGGLQTGTFGVIRYDGALSGAFNGIVEDTWYTWSGDPAIEYKINYAGNDGTGTAIMLTVIPEPHTLGLLLAAGALLALRRRRG